MATRADGISALVFFIIGAFLLYKAFIEEERSDLGTIFFGASGLGSWIFGMGILGLT